MVGRVFLHIGTMKSATSHLQQLFDENSGEAADQGLYWPGASNCFLACGDLLETSRTRPGLEGAWARLDRELRAREGSALISNELLAMSAGAKREQIIRALAPAEVRLVVTARDLMRVVPSQWQTGMRNRKTVTWPDYLAALRSKETTPVGTWFWRRQDIPAILRRWSKRVPLDRVTVVTVPPAGSDPSLVGERFATAVGIDAGSFHQPSYSNASLGTISAELMRRLNERTADLDWLQYMWAFKNGLSRVILAERAGSEPPITLDEATRQVITKRARRMVAALDRMGVQVVGDLSDLLPGPSPQTAGVEDVADSELLKVAIEAFAGLGRLLGVVRAEHEELIVEVERRLGIRGNGRQPGWHDVLPDEADNGIAELSLAGRLAMSRHLRARMQERPLSPEPV